MLLQLWTTRIWRCAKSVSLEVASLLFMASVLMTYLIMQDFVFGRVCRVNLGYSEEVCQALVRNTGNYTTEETEVQKIMTQLRRTRSMLDYTIPIVFVIFQGSWSDLHGRKLAMLLPCVGFFLQAMSLFMSMFFEHWDGYTVVLISTIPKCLSGSEVTFQMAALSYISDISTKHVRTFKTGLISAAFTLGVPMGFALGGAAVKASLDLRTSFLISASICVVSFFIIVIFVENSPKLAVEPDLAINKKKNVDKKCFTLSNMKSALKSLTLSFDGVSTSTRIQIFVLIFAIVCINAPIQGEFGVMYLYLRKKLMWDLGNYGMFSTYVSLIGVIGTILSMGIFCSLLKLSDPVIGFIAGISQFAGCFMYAFAYNNLMIYMAPTIDMLNGTMAVVAKSMLSKLTPPEDYGKMFSCLAVIELLVPLVFDPTYSIIYEHTMDTLPGAVFLLSAAMTVPPQLTYLLHIWTHRNAKTCEITDINGSKDMNSRKNPDKLKSIESLSTDSHYSHPAPVTLKAAISTATVDTVVY